MNDDKLTQKFKNLHWKGKLLVGFVGLSIFYAIIFYIALPKNPKVSENPPQNNSSSSQIPTAVPSSFPSSGPASSVNWQVYQTDRFEIRYPPDWEIEKKQIVNGGEETILKPSSSEALFPVLKIFVEPSSKSASLKQKETILRSLGFVETETLFNKIKAWQFTLKKESHSEVRLFLVKENFTYNIEYSFSDSLQSAVLERMLSSFRFSNLGQ